MTIFKVLGKIGAVAAGGAALLLAGKSGLGESLFAGGDKDVKTSDLEKNLAPIEPTEETTVEDTTAEQEEVSE